ncbi:hypothetical protein BH09BAC5_BH09BAC5_07990 [soil metagenome]
MKFNLVLIIIYLSVVFPLKAKNNSDTIPAGVIKVHCPPVIAEFSVFMNVIYEDSQNNRKKAETDIPTKSNNGDSVNNGLAPKPILDHYSSDAGFDWNGMLKKSGYVYQWLDSTKADSARFVFTIDKNGKATCKLMPNTKEDSSSLAFEQKIKPYLFLLNQWIPAQKAKAIQFGNKRFRTKRIASIVVITVYAFDPNAGKLLPIEISPK